MLCGLEWIGDRIRELFRSLMKRLKILFVRVLGFFGKKTKKGVFYVNGTDILPPPLSKEEEGHTGEFLFSLPVGKAKVIGAKWLAVFTNIVVFNLLCVAVYCVGFAVSGESIPAKEFALFHAMQLFMHTQVGAMCFAVSACSKRNRIGVGLGAALLLYAFDTVARILPDLADYKFISPFSYSNASDIFSSGEVYTKGALLGAALLVISLATAFGVYSKRDLAS